MQGDLTKSAIALAVGVALGWLGGLASKRQPADDDGDSEYETDEEEGAGQASRPRGSRSAAAQPSFQAAARSSEELKMVLVVNSELKMGKGKIGAQCAHAAVGAVERLHERGGAAVLRRWESCGQPKICLQASTTAELRQLAAEASGRGIPTFIVQDAGRTQVAPGSRTVLAIGPAPKSAIDGVTGRLKLL